MNDPHGLCGGVDMAAVEASIGSLAISLREQGYADDHIRAGVIEAIAEMGLRAHDRVAEKAKAGGSGFVVYLCKVIKSKVKEIDKDARARAAHVEEAAARVATTKAIQGKRGDAFDKKVAAGNAKFNGQHYHGRYTEPDGSGRQEFEPAAKLSPIAKVSIAGVHGNLVLDQARKVLPNTTPCDVDEALAIVSGAFDTAETVSMTDIIAKAVDALRGKAAHKIHGDPEKRCSRAGAPACIKPCFARRRTIHTTSLRIHISELLFSELGRKYPDCARNPDGMSSEYELATLRERAWQAASEAVGDLDWDDYPEFAAKAEAAAEQVFREAHEKFPERDAAAAAARERKAAAEAFAAKYRDR
jgi:hypothetical protein